MTKQLADVKADYTYFRDGDIVLAKITPCLENQKGALAAALTNGIGFGTTELHVLRPTESDPQLPRHLAVREELRRAGGEEVLLQREPVEIRHPAEVGEIPLEVGAAEVLQPDLAVP